MKNAREKVKSAQVSGGARSSSPPEKSPFREKVNTVASIAIYIIIALIIGFLIYMGIESERYIQSKTPSSDHTSFARWRSMQAESSPEPYIPDKLGAETKEGMAEYTQDVILVNSFSSRKISLSDWSRPQGDLLTIFPPTYVFDPCEMTKPEMTIKPTVTKPGSPIEVTFRFIVHRHTHYGNSPWKHGIRLLFGVPVNESYKNVWGSFKEIPGELVSYQIAALDKCSGDSAEVILPVTHDDSQIIGKVRWKPHWDLPSIEYESSNPWKGPRVILTLHQEWYNWRYTQGFIIRQNHPVGASSGE